MIKINKKKNTHIKYIYRKQEQKEKEKEKQKVFSTIGMIWMDRWMNLV